LLLFATTEGAVIGKTIGPFEVSAMPGAGEMGQVYRARARFSMHLVTNWRRLLQKPAR